MIRPAARDAILRTAGLWGPGLGVALGAYWVLWSGGVLRWCGWVLILAGAGLMIAGWQRMRFRMGSDGPGVVRVDEGQIAYFGPLTGGVVARSELRALVLDHTSRPAHWVLGQAGQPDVYIPVNADGAEALFDAFASLPGLKTETMLHELHNQSPRRVTLWGVTSFRLH